MFKLFENNLNFYLLLTLLIIYSFVVVKSEPPFHNNDLCIFQSDPLALYPVCPNYFNNHGHVSIYEFNDNPTEKFTKCVFKLTNEVVDPIYYTPIPYENYQNDFECFNIEGNDCSIEAMLDEPNNPLRNYTSTIDFCSIIGTCIPNSLCFCYYPILHQEYCLNFPDNIATKRAFSEYHSSDFSFLQNNLVPLSIVFVDHPDITLLFHKRGFDMVSNFVTHYKLKITTFHEIIKFNTTQNNLFSFTFPHKYDSMAFPYLIEIYDSDSNLLYRNVSETTTDDFCENPDCLFCSKSYNHFNCLSTERKLLFGVVLTVLFLIMIILLAIILYYLLPLIPKVFRFIIHYSKVIYYMPIMYKPITGCTWCFNRIKAMFYTTYKNEDIGKELLKDYEKQLPSQSYIEYISHKYNINENYFVSFRQKELNSKLISKGTNLKTSLRNYKLLYPSGNIPNFYLTLLIVCILISFSSSCNIGSTSQATVSNCQQSGQSEYCVVQYQTSFSIDRIFNVYCSTIQDQDGNNLANLRVGFINAYTTLNYVLRYYTSSWQITTQSNFRCSHASGSYCETSYCNAPNRNAFGNLNDPYINKTYGQTFCDPVMPSGFDCLLPQPGCLWSEWSLVPSKDFVNSVYDYNNHNPVTVGLYIELESNGLFFSQFNDISQSQSIVLQQSDGFPGDITITLDLPPTFSVDEELTRVSYPFGFTKSVINPLADYTNGKIGDIQSNTPSSFEDPNYYTTVLTQPNSIISSKQIIGHGVVYNTYIPGLNRPFDARLPSTISDIDYSLIDPGTQPNYNNFLGVFANISNPTPIQLNIISNFEITRQIASCLFDIRYLRSQGCCKCITNAYIEYEITYAQGNCDISFFSTDVNLITLIPNFQNRIYFETDNCDQNVVIEAQSPGYVKQMEFRIALDEPELSTQDNNGITTFVDYETSYDPETSFDFNLPKGLFNNIGKSGKVSLLFTFIFAIILLIVCLYFSCSIGKCLMDRVLPSKKIN